jgi:UDP-3-O-[3-hydroxymyristoyl] glucosamine N-acyltransferase
MPVLRQSDHRLTVGEIVGLTGSTLKEGGAADRRIANIASLDLAGAADICFLEDPKFLDELKQTRAGACLIAPGLAALAPPQLAVLFSDDPYRDFVAVARALFPGALRPTSLFGASGRAAGAQLHPSARIEAGVTIDPLAVIGPGAEVGAGTVIAAGAAIGPNVCIGRHCAVGAGATILNALIGDRVVLGPGARLGHEGAGYRGQSPEVEMVPQTKRVIVQDAAEIGANAAVDRGVARDTVIGEGTRVGNLVYIAQGAMIGRHCLLGAQSGISGGVTIGDFVVINERVGVAENLAIGAGARVARGSMVDSDIEPGVCFAGAPEPLRSDR